MTKVQKTKKEDFVEIKFAGYHDGKVFDSNIPEELKKLNPEAKPKKTITIIGQGMVIPGLDKALEDKELNKEYEIESPYKQGFGERKRELVKTIPLKVFTEQKINPYPGATFFMDQMLARVITVSGARVVTDFNNPLSGKDLTYKFTIIRIVTDEKEKCEAFFKFFLRLEKPNFEINEKNKKVILKAPKPFEYLVNMNKPKFKEIFGKELEFEEEKEINKEKQLKDEEKLSSVQEPDKQASTEKQHDNN